MLYGNPRHAVEAARRGKFTTHGIKQRRTPFTRAGNPGLLSHARYQIRDDERHDQHYRECHDILHVRHRKREPRWHEEEIEGRYVCDCARDSRDHAQI